MGAAGTAVAAEASDLTPTTCTDGTAPPCIVTWTLSSRFVDPERVLINTGKLNFSPEDPTYTEGGVVRPSHQLETKIHLPKGYDGVKRFPVLYLLHGQNGRPDVWLDPSCGMCVDFEPLFRELEAIVVMVEGGDFGLYSNWWTGGRGEASVSGWERYHLEEVIPAIERNLKIRHGRRWRAIFGASMGGLGAVRYAAQCPDCFGTAGSLSGLLDTQDPVMVTGVCPGSAAINLVGHGRRAAENDTKRCEDAWGNPVAQEFYWSAHNPLNLTANLTQTRVYVAHGNLGDPSQSELPADQEIWLGSQAPRWVETAEKDGVDVEYKPHDGNHHGRRWLTDLEDAIERWGIFAPVEERPTTWSFKTVSQHGRMWGLEYSFSSPPEEIAVFKRNGQTLSATGRGTVTVAVSGGHSFTLTLPFEVTLPRGP